MKVYAYMMGPGYYGPRDTAAHSTAATIVPAAVTQSTNVPVSTGHATFVDSVGLEYWWAVRAYHALRTDSGGLLVESQFLIDAVQVRGVVALTVQNFAHPSTLLRVDVDISPPKHIYLSIHIKKFYVSVNT